MLPVDGAGIKHGMTQSMAAGASMQMFMRVLQSSTLGLEQLVRQAMASNPVLEEEPPPEPDEPWDEGWESALPADADAGRKHDYLLDSFSESSSLTENLREQVMRSALEPTLEKAVLLLIDELNPHGFFDDPPEEAARRLGISKSLLRRALAVLHDLEPAGVGARDLRESLLIQLAQLGESRSLAARLVAECWDALARRRYDAAARALGVDEEEVLQAAQRIARLNPDPGAAFAREERAGAPPDLAVRVDEKGDVLVVPTGGAAPRLRIDGGYREMLAERADDREVRSYLSRCFREGRELMKAIADRQATILAIGKAIVERQKKFFRQGPGALRPLKMEEIAADTGVHVSTVSRAVNDKYLVCAWGLFELRSFFQTALPTQGESGEAGAGASTGAVQSRIRALIAGEDPAKPLSDAKIEALLAREGIVVARRTIAKYREQMKILPASFRKRR